MEYALKIAGDAPKNLSTHKGEPYISNVMLTDVLGD
jgi:hypothetical protein